jgi:hypothetical protein
MAEGLNSICKRSATHSPHHWCEFHSVRMAGECKSVQLRGLIVFDGRAVRVLNIGLLYALSVVLLFV